jgi:hypothetical protein
VDCDLGYNERDARTPHERPRPGVSLRLSASHSHSTRPFGFVRDLPAQLGEVALIALLAPPLEAGQMVAPQRLACISDPLAHCHQQGILDTLADGLAS